MDDFKLTEAHIEALKRYIKDEDKPAMDEVLIAEIFEFLEYTVSGDYQQPLEARIAELEAIIKDMEGDDNIYFAKVDARNIVNSNDSDEEKVVQLSDLIEEL